MAMKARYTVVNREVIAEKRGGVRSLYVPDPLGSTVALLDNTQTQTDTFSYWPYGEVSNRTGTTPTPFTYVGTQGYHQDSSSRNYVRARTLKTNVSRWLTRDPLWPAEPPYSYAMANPVSIMDRSGLKCTGFFCTGFCDQNDNNDCIKQCAEKRDTLAVCLCFQIPCTPLCVKRCKCRGDVTYTWRNCGLLAIVGCTLGCDQYGGMKSCKELVTGHGDVVEIDCTCRSDVPITGGLGGGGGLS